MKTKSYFEKLLARCDSADTNLCVGIDPDPRRIPSRLGNGPQGVYKFCSEIVEATADAAAAFKPNIAFFESLGVEGWHVLDQVLQGVPEGVPVIIDAKRGDIGSTALHYARSIFDRLRADAITLNPLLGFDSIEPFLKYESRGLYLLCLTSNEGARDFQLHHDLYLRIAKKATEWNTAGTIGLVVGATKSEQMKKIRTAAPDLPVLIPGLGEQGGNLEDTVVALRDAPRHHMLFNVSRSILFASDGADFGHAARKAARYYRDIINRAREKTLHD